FQGPGVDQVLAEDHGGGDVRWLLADHQGTTRDVVSNAGAVVNHVTFDSYGRVLSQTDAAEGTRYLFTGREFDASTRLYYYRARHSDATVGRFLSEDPPRFGGGDGNLYRYVGNKVVSLIDPSGWMPGDDLRQVDWIAKKYGIDRKEFGKRIHEEK